MWIGNWDLSKMSSKVTRAAVLPAAILRNAGTYALFGIQQSALGQLKWRLAALPKVTCVTNFNK